MLIYWFKFNIYSSLLIFIALTLVTATIIFWSFLNLWLLIPIFGAVWFCVRKAFDIFHRFEYKMQVFKLLTEKLRAKYDLRYCYPYMGSACMRSVVYFSLYELGKQKDYAEVKRRRFHHDKNDTNPRAVDVSMENGKLVFVSKNILTGEKEII